jgi:hypothetical protein
MCANKKTRSKTRIIKDAKTHSLCVQQCNVNSQHVCTAMCTFNIIVNKRDQYASRAPRHRACTTTNPSLSTTLDTGLTKNPSPYTSIVTDGSLQCYTDPDCVHTY